MNVGAEQGVKVQCTAARESIRSRRKEKVFARRQVRPDPVVEPAHVREAEGRKFPGHAQIRLRVQVAVSRDRLKYQKNAAPFNQAGE